MGWSPSSKIRTLRDPAQFRDRCRISGSQTLIGINSTTPHLPTPN
jgi:hypothetical protein